MYKLIIALLLLYSGNTYAENYSFSHYQMVKSPINNTAPQIFLFNSKGELMHYSDKYLPNILSIFKNKQSHPDSDLLKSNLEQLLTALPDFTQQKYTLIYTSIDEDVGPCPPCRQQEKTIDILKNKFSDKQLKVHSISINASDYGMLNADKT
ncbi:hypothetical protein [Pseudoalteromonas sp. S1612]|uniref:hypothetical protein n=1 Tax=Pseudoalteromonas sp. S1612 TaxID=579507 RepID=UPI00110A7F4C|nr:hypothetical protein [Pseudoalteromonas sp. S1612]TMP56570.1 hypothetical protein CWB78_05380 [Pseudoalteromonas sp. S1612]